MKEDTLFINVGTIVEEDDLIEILKEKLIRHAYLDVFENEPLESEHPLYDLDNVTITAHITGNDKENKRKQRKYLKEIYLIFSIKEKVRT